ncbi:hypothetical protein Goe16_02300 [Bacillus phage vB_BsuM-Goe16]|nr:hypothetical protein Goe16_00360 [Bacillus phage vB_BsuM-Goe16]WCS68644.1 hypothetical protein Goe16_02300 [Bacillus phage vB_BsuM-Goe16]
MKHHKYTVAFQFVEGRFRTRYPKTAEGVRKVLAQEVPEELMHLVRIKPPYQTEWVWLHEWVPED